ncbi:MAG: HEPN domain-containing protein [Bacteroidota bacterium]|jgi:HEPN domain-containing protein
MSDAKKEIVEKVKQWIEIAEEDLRLAKFAFEMSSNIPYRLIAYHAQQAAEKYIKALLVFCEIDFPYTHSIEKLLSLAPKEHGLANSLSDAGDLTDYAVGKRYPDFYEKLDKSEAEKAVELAENVKKKIRDLLNSSGLVL